MKPVNRRRRSSAAIVRGMRIRVGDIVGGCFITGWILVILLFGVNALIGLITGEIYLPNKKGGGGTLQGAAARIVSLIIVVICAFILSTLWRRRRGIHRRADVMREVGRREGSGDDEGRS